MYEELKKLAEAAPEGPWFGPEYAPGTSYVFDVDLGTLLHYESIDTEKDACLRYVAAANPSAVLALIAENEGYAKKIEWDKSWYGCRFETLFHWAHRELNEEQKTQYFNIVANGSSSPLDPPTYAQQMNVLKWKVRSADKERDMFKTENERLECMLENYKIDAKIYKDSAEQLRADNEALRKDAKRYWFIRDVTPYEELIEITDGATSGDDWDLMLDEAMGKEPAQ